MGLSCWIHLFDERGPTPVMASKLNNGLHSELSVLSSRSEPAGALETTYRCVLVCLVLLSSSYKKFLPIFVTKHSDFSPMNRQLVKVFVQISFLSKKRELAIRMRLIREEREGVEREREREGEIEMGNGNQFWEQ